MSTIDSNIGNLDTFILRMARLETEDHYVIDELRIATTFAEAAGVPEPASLTQLAFGAVGLAVYCWRRRRPSRASRGA